MIISIWKPYTKSFNKKQRVIYYELFEGDINKKGTSGYKIIWRCDNTNCLFPNKIHSINRSHLNINRSDKMHENLQICKSCQQKGESNPRYGDKRKWEDIMGKERASILKGVYRINFINNNPSSLEKVKIKKGQFIINFDNVSEYTQKFGYNLNEIDGNNKHAIIKLTCPNNHNSTMKYSSFKKGHRCILCYYDSIRINIEDIRNFEQYSRKVRLLTSISYRKNKNIIDPLNLKSKLYHIDHRYSISDGFKNHIDPIIISSIWNLRLIKSEDNLKKGPKSEITIELLMEKYNQKII